MDNFDDGIDWEEMAIIGALSEEIADEERERLKLEQEVQAEEERLQKYHDELEKEDDW